MYTKQILSFLLFFHVLLLSGQTWKIISSEQIENKGIRDIIPEKYIIYSVDDEVLKSILWDSPKEPSVSALNSNKIINVGLPDGGTENFRIVEYDMMESELAEQYPYIKTFYGVSVNNPLKSVRIDYTLQGFRAVISSPDEGKIYVDHYQRNDNNTRIVYYRRHYKKIPDWECNFDGDLHDEPRKKENITNRIGDCQLRSYRLAQATTGEYSNFHGATSSAQSGLVMSAVTTVINRVNEVYEADVAVRLILIANTAQVFYYNPSTDPYTNNNVSTMLGENISTCNSVIGSANYDIGHVFSTGGGGVAYLQCVCGSSKAGGVTGSSNPVGDPFSIDYVAHEMGHQFGGNHTQYNACNRNAPTAMEPGSASTIMGYAGICSPNVQNNSDPYFHAKNIDEIKTFLNVTGNGCAQIVGSFVNNAPIVVSQPNYTIPKSTPFVLTLSASDPDGNPMTYLWDEMDAYSNPAQTMPPASTNTTGPMFRSISATSSPSRYFPPLSNILNNTSNTWQVLPSVSRTMNFRGVAKDFTGVAGCNSEINLTVSTVVASGPFVITSQNITTNWLEGETNTITWDVAGTTGNGINTANVSILLSYDGGNTFPVTLISSTPNDGSENITVPAGITSSARIMVKAVNNIYFDINDVNINIVVGAPTFGLGIDPTNYTLCTSGIIYINVNVMSILGFSEPVTLSVSNLPAGVSYSFTQNPVMPGQTSILTLSEVNAATGFYSIQVTGSSGSIVKNKSFELQVVDLPTSVTLISPVYNATNISIKPLLSWSNGTGATSYELQISREPDFGSFILNVGSTVNSFQVSEMLEGFSVFYWRVRSSNSCGFSDWSPIFSFTTESCFVYISTDVPVIIPSSGTPTVNSHLTVSDKGIITDLDIWSLTGIHTYIDDLKFTLFAPNSANQLFWNQPCNSEDNFNINFDQSAANNNWPCPPTNGGTYKPSNGATLNAYNSISVNGNWRMQIQDIFDGDGGSLQSWKLKTCVNNFCRLKVDNTYSKGAGSLYAAVNCANTGDTIRFSSSIMNDTIDLGSESLVINKHIVIESDLTKNIHIFSSGAGATIQNSAPSTSVGLVIKGVHIHSPGLNAEAIENNGKLVLDDVFIHNYPGSSNPTLINNEGSSIEIKGNCTIIDE